MDPLDDGHSILYTSAEQYLLPIESTIDEQKPENECMNHQINFSNGICHIYRIRQQLLQKLQNTSHDTVISTIRLECTC